MFKKYIRNIVKEQIDGIRLENTLKQSKSKIYWEENFKGQVRHTELLVKARDKEISILKESIENLDGKLTLKGNLLSEQKQENEKLKEKLYNIKGIIHVQYKRTYTNDNLMRTFKLIEDILKES